MPESAAGAGSGGARCPLCGSASARLEFRKQDATYLRCLSCTAVYQHPQPTRAHLQEVYSKEYYVKSEGSSESVGYRDYMTRTNLRIARNLFAPVAALGEGAGRSLLDVGCATGNVLEVARQHGWVASGIEVSPWAAARARERGFPVSERPLEECEFAPAMFDAVTLFDVLEHFPDPRASLQVIHRLLKPGGVFVLETPNVEGVAVRYFSKVQSIIVQPHAHLVLFSKKTLRDVLTRSGFVILSMKAFPISGTMGEFFRTLVRRAVKKALHAFDYRIGPLNVRKYFKQSNEIELPEFTINDSLHVVAKKN